MQTKERETLLNAALSNECALQLYSHERRPARPPIRALFASGACTRTSAWIRSLLPRKLQVHGKLKAVEHWVFRGRRRDVWLRKGQLRLQQAKRSCGKPELGHCRPHVEGHATSSLPTSQRRR